MTDMASTATNVAALASSMLAIGGGLVAQVSSSPGVADAGIYVGAGGLAAALALLVSSLGDKVGPHVVAIAKLIVENRESNIRLKGENLTLAQRIVEMEARLARTEAEAATAKDAANEFENKLIDLRARANARFNAVEATVEDIHQRVDIATGSKDDLPAFPGGDDGDADDTPPASPSPLTPPPPPTPAPPPEGPR